MSFEWEICIAGRLISMHVLYKRGKYSKLWGKSGKREGERERSAHTVARDTSLQKAHAQETDTLQLYTCITILIYDNPREEIYIMISAYSAQVTVQAWYSLLPRQAYVFRIAVSSSKHQCMHAPASLRSQIDGASKDVQIFRRPSVWCRKRFSVALFPGKTFGGICICSLKWLILATCCWAVVHWSASYIRRALQLHNLPV